jgi:hypothetical protein
MQQAGMPEEVPPKERPMPFMTGGDWSVGINSPSSLRQVEVLAVLGRGLQKLYDEVVEEGIPEHLAPFVEELEGQRHAREG